MFPFSILLLYLMFLTILWHFVDQTRSHLIDYEKTKRVAALLRAHLYICRCWVTTICKQKISAHCCFIPSSYFILRENVFWAQMILIVSRWAVITRHASSVNVITDNIHERKKFCSKMSSKHFEVNWKTSLFRKTKLNVDIVTEKHLHCTD